MLLSSDLSEGKKCIGVKINSVVLGHPMFLQIRLLLFPDKDNDSESKLQLEVAFIFNF